MNWENKINVTMVGVDGGGRGEKQHGASLAVFGPLSLLQACGRLVPHLHRHHCSAAIKLRCCIVLPTSAFTAIPSLQENDKGTPI